MIAIAGLQTAPRQSLRNCRALVSVGDRGFESDSDSPRMHVPRSFSHLMQSQLLRHFCWRHRCETSAQSLLSPRGLAASVASRRSSSPPGRSCLFANTINKQSRISLSNRIRSSSSRASSIRSRSPESMTKIRPYKSASATW